MTLDALTASQFFWLIVAVWAGVCLLATVIGKRIGTRIRQRAVRKIALERLETYCDPATPLEVRESSPAVAGRPAVRARDGVVPRSTPHAAYPALDQVGGYGRHTTLIFPAKTREQGQ